MATRMDESFLRRNATSTESSMVTTSLAGTIVARAQSLAGAKASGKPTSSSSASGCLSRKARQAGRVTDGPWSPPMQSTARRTEGREEPEAVMEKTNKKKDAAIQKD